MTGPPDEILPLYRAVRLVGLMGLLILTVGLIEFLSFEPPGQATGTTATIAGVYAYDPVSQAVRGPSAGHFGRDQPFAAVVDWSSIPASTVVSARWFDTFGEVVGKAGPAPAGEIDAPWVPVALPEGLKSNIPGTYLFVVERMAHGQAVEVLARRLIEVERR
jgi:hypothetical protein